MATGAIGTHIVGLDQLRPARTKGLMVGPITTFLIDAAVLVQSRARELAPVDNGYLKNDISFELDPNPAPWPVFVNVGTTAITKDYAKAMEGGTGLLADLPGGVGRPYFPPPSALEAWAAKHPRKDGTPNSGYLVARGIFMAGGTKPRRFLRGAMEQKGDAINARIPLLAAAIVASVESSGLE